MSIINPISSGGGGVWAAVANTAAESYRLTFPVDHEPSDWIVFSITDRTSLSSSKYIVYIGKINQSDTHRCTWETFYNSSGGGEYNLYSSQYATGTYNSGTDTFEVSVGYDSPFYDPTVGEYVLIYI